MTTQRDSRLEIVQAPDGSIRCVYLNDYRIAGSKPWVSMKCKTIATFAVSDKDLKHAVKP